MSALDGEKSKILLVDDDESIRYLLTITLERAGFSVRSAENGLQALEMLDADGADAIILDLMMPVMDGLRFLEETRGKRGLDTPILVMTAGLLSEPGAVDDLIEAGATEVARKPLSPPDLLARLRRMCAR